VFVNFGGWVWGEVAGPIDWIIIKTSFCMEGYLEQRQTYSKSLDNAHFEGNNKKDRFK